MYEEIINLYLDVDMEVDGGRVYVDRNDAKAEIVMTSVEATKMKYKAEVKMDFEDMSGDHVLSSTGSRESLSSFVEDIEMTIRQLESHERKTGKSNRR